MKHIKVFCILLLFFISSFQVHASKIQWAKFLKDTTRVLTPRSYVIQGKCVDSYDNIYFCYYINSIDTSISFVTKLSPDGQILWHKSLFPFQNNNRIFNRYDMKYQMHIDQNQNLIIAGALWDTIGFSTNNYYKRMLFFNKLNLNGDQIFQKMIPITQPNYSVNGYISDMKLLPNGDIYLCHYFSDNFDYRCLIYGVNQQFDSLFSFELNMIKQNINNKASRSPIMAINDTSITLVYSMWNSFYKNHYMLQLSLSNADTNWIKMRMEYGDTYTKSQIEITNNNIYLVSSGIEKYSLTGDSIYFNRNNVIDNIIIDTSSGIIYGIKLQAQNDINIYKFDTNLLLVNTFLPQYSAGIDKRLLSMTLTGESIITYGYSWDINDNNKLISLDVNQMNLNGIFINQEKVNLDSYVLNLFSIEGVLVDNKQDVILLTTLKLKSLFDSVNNSLFSMPIFGCKFIFNTPINISGTVYIDDNTNCQQDSSEKGLENNLIHLLPEDNYTYTDSSGFYSFIKYNGAATIEYMPYINGLNNCVASGSYSINVLNNSIVDSLDFGMHSSIINFDAKCTLYTAVGRPGYIQRSNVILQNIGTTQLHNVRAILIIDSSYTIQNASILPDSIIGNKAYWSFDSLWIGKIKNIYIDLSPNPTLYLGYIYNYSLQIFADGDTVTTINNNDTAKGTVVGSFDPNHKLVDPMGQGEDGFIDNNSTLNYYIEFQNTGTDTAFNVKLTDELDQHLDISTLLIKGSSHPMNYTLNNRILTFYFNNILLPDSNKDYQKSIGYAAYSIKPKQNILGKKIKNKANIFFDFNEPITTNTTLHTIGLPTNILNYIEDDIIAFPNPLTGNQLTININIVSTGKTKVELYDISGRKIHTILDAYKEKGMYQYKLDKSLFISNQLYFISLTTQNSKKAIKIFKN